MTQWLGAPISSEVKLRDELREELIAMIKTKAAAAPRSLQVELGPSEIGHPCYRKIAYQLLQVPRCNPEYDPLPSIIGTATHHWLEGAARYANEQLGHERWWVETKVKVAEDISGHCDLYDSDNHVVIDYKFPGTSRFTKYRKEMNIVYRRQAHFYGLGFENAGLPVRRVAIALLPRGGTLHNMHLWSEDYSREYALDGLRKHRQVIELMDDLDVESNPERFQWLPVSGPDCLFCSHFAPRPKSPYECAGSDAHRTPAETRRP
jgi:hypothetical protein